MRGWTTSLHTGLESAKSNEGLARKKELDTKPEERYWEKGGKGPHRIAALERDGGSLCVGRSFDNQIGSKKENG